MFTRSSTCSCWPPLLPWIAFCLLLVATPVTHAGGLDVGRAPDPPISGIVVDPDARPVPGATVVAETPAGRVGTAATDRAGRFAFTSLGAGSYTLRAMHAGFRGVPQDVRVAADDHLDLVLTLAVAAVTDTVVVSAGQVESSVSSSPAAVVAFTAGDLEARQIDSVAEALRLAPGVSVAQSGGPGALTSVFPRGGESDYTLAMVDGMRLNAFGGGFDFSTVPVGEIERLEVVRGPQSAIFGADAIGGIVQVVTRQGGPVRAGGVIEGGSEQTARGSAWTAGSTGPWSWGGSAERMASDGFTGPAPATGERVSNDDMSFTSVGGNVRFARDSWAAALRARNFRSERGFPGPYGSDPNHTYPGVDRVSRGWNDDVNAGLEASATPSPRLRVRGFVSFADLESRYRSPYDTSVTDTRRTDGRVQVDVAARTWLGLTTGVEALGERAESTYITGLTTSPVPVRRSITGAFADGRLALGPSITANAGVRVEYIRRDLLPPDPYAYTPRPQLDADTVTSVNPRVAFNWLMSSSDAGAFAWTSVRASAGTGIRPPDAFEIAFTDNPGLRPERSRSVDAGVEEGLARGRVVMEAIAFLNEYDDLIVAVGPASQDASHYRTDNIANARARGAEIAVTARPWPCLQIRSGYTFLDTEILAVDGTSGVVPPPFAPGDPLIRRPRHQGFVDVAATGGRWSGFVRVGARGRVLDVDPTYGAFGGKLTAPGYASTDLGGSVRVWRDVWLFGRVTNVFDRAYEETFGFPSPGRRAFGGLRVAARR